MWNRLLIGKSGGKEEEKEGDGQSEGKYCGGFCMFRLRNLNED